MWRNITPINPATLAAFEKRFNFRIAEPFKSFLIEHNAGIPSNGTFPTVYRERQLVQFLDFADQKTRNGAWATNTRLRDQIGDQRIIVGLDVKGNYVCLERHWKNQKIVVWSHVTGQFEPSLLDIPAFLRAIN